MCNVCNSGVNTRCGCSCNMCGGFWNTFWNTNTQSVCRDCCGNIRANQARCGYNAYAQNTDTSTSCAAVQTTSGCGGCQSNLSQLNGDAYYVRLYALNNTTSTASTNGCGGSVYNGCGGCNGYNWNNRCGGYNGCGTCFGCCRSRCPYTWTVEDATDNT